MNTGKGDSHPKTLSGTSNPGTETPKSTGLDAVVKMYHRSQTSNPQNYLEHISNRPEFRLPPTSNVDVSTEVDKSPCSKVIRTSSPRRVPKERDKFARCEHAHRQSIEGMVPICRYILRSKPNILRLIEPSRKGLVNSPQDVELQALNTPIAPVNKDTMKELELGAIQNNTSLRIDLCFDDQLFFQPIKGRKGEEKQRRARIFWDCLCLELNAYRHAIEGGCSECAKAEDNSRAAEIQIPSRLAEFFSALRDLIEMLVPDKDKATILAKLDVDHLVRMSRVGHFDAVEFSGWLAQLLMTHCAPLRDGMARKMNQQIADGARKNDMDLLVKGLETLLALLENMKLDVANHQVRSFKLLLIADTVPFLQDCFSKMQADQQLDPKSARKWFKELRRKHRHEYKSDFEIFIFGAVMLCKSPCKAIPTTFTYDKDRLVCLRNEVLDLTQLRICIDTFEELAISRQGRQPTATKSTEISDRLLLLMSSEDGNSEGVACHLDEIATEIARAASGVSTEVKSQDADNLDLQYVLDRLETRLADEQFSVMGKVLEELIEGTMHYAFQFQKLDTLQVSNAQRVWTTKRSSKSLTPAPEIEDIARRMAHIIVIHWAVWAKLVYLEDDEVKPLP